MGYIIKKCISLILCILILTLTLTSPPIVSASTFSVYDAKQDKTYSIDDKDFSVYIQGSDLSVELPLSDNIINIICFDGLFSFLCYTRDLLYSVYTYDTNTGNFESFYTDLPADLHSSVFTVNINGYAYILDSNNHKIIYIYKNNNCVSFLECNTDVYQMMNTAYGFILVFATDGVYRICDSSMDYISDIRIATPYVYSGNNIIRDTNGNEYVITEDGLESLHSQPTDSKSTQPPNENTDNLTITSEYIYLEYGTTFAKLYKALGIDKSQLTVTKPDRKVITSGKLGTGMTAKWNNQNLSIVITGDLTGEGNINSRDLKALMKHLSEESPLSNSFLKAADVYSDSTINTKDLLYLSNMY